MKTSFCLVEGVSVSNIDGIHEAFCRTEKGFIANVSAEKILPFILEFLEMQNDLMFFVMELPCAGDEEAKLRKSDRTPFHKNIYYMDKLGQPEAMDIIKYFGEILINDGMSGFGFGTPHGKEEIYISQYKIIYLYSKNASRYLPIFEKVGIIQEDKIETIRDRVDKDHPGDRFLFKKGSKDIYSVFEDLKLNGLYFGETIEDQ